MNPRLHYVAKRSIVAGAVINTLVIGLFISCKSIKRSPKNQMSNKEIDVGNIETFWNRSKIKSMNHHQLLPPISSDDITTSIPLLHFDEKLIYRNVPIKETNRFGNILRKTNTKVIENKTGVNDIFFSVRTSKVHHFTTLSLMLETWISVIPGQVVITTDQKDDNLALKLLDIFGAKSPAIKVSTCLLNSGRKWAVLCTMLEELEIYKNSPYQESWFCHFEDNTFVNIKQLLQLLYHFDSNLPYYLGRPISINKPTVSRTYNLDRVVKIIGQSETEEVAMSEYKAFYFAAKEAGFCLSRKLVSQMNYYLQGPQIIKIASSISLPHDYIIGYIINELLKVPLTYVPLMHSYLQNITSLDENYLAGQITFCFREEGNLETFNSIDGTERKTVIRVNDILYKTNIIK